MRPTKDIEFAPIHPDLDLNIRSPSKKAGGVKAVISSQKFIRKSLGLVEGNWLLSQMNQKEGFDCPGCAWPDPENERSMAEFCENGAKALAEEACNTLLKPDYFVSNSLSEISQLSDYELGHLGRIEQPMYLAPDSNYYEAISWDKAFNKISDRLSQTTAERCIFYTSGRTSNEAAFLYQLLAKQKGTNNLPDCSNLCHESSGTALTQSIGIGKGTVKLEDFTKANLILIFGQNPGTNHPRMLSALRDAVKKGAKVISINPIFEAGLKSFSHPQKLQDLIFGGIAIAQKHISVRINGDQALLMGLGKILGQKRPSGMDPQFIKDSCEGLLGWQKNLKSVPWELILDESGVSYKEIESLAEDIMNSESMISCWAMGLTQQPNAVSTIRELCNIHLWGGFIGRPGSGLCPVRGHSNVQGNRTVGIYEKPNSAFVTALENQFGLSFPSKHGLDVVDSIKAMNDEKVDFLMSLGGNLLSASPDTEVTAKALEKVATCVYISTKLNRGHLVTGQEAFILPCLARSELDISYQTMENSMGYVHGSRGKRKPKSDFWLSEVNIISTIGHQTFKEEKIPWLSYADNYDLIRDHIEATIPGFSAYNDKTRDGRGFYLPNPPRDHRKFATKSGLAAFHIGKLQPISLAPDQFIMMTIRSHDQYNTTIYGLDDRYRGIYQGRRVLFMNPKDMDQLDLIKNEEVDITSYFRDETREAKYFRVIPYDIPQRCLASYFPEANILVPLDSFASESQTPTSKFIRVKVAKATR